MGLERCRNKSNLVMEKKCAYCGKPIPSDRKSNNTKYCSLKCQRKASVTPEVVSKIVSRGKKKSDRHPNLVSAYDYKCAICGWSIPTWQPGYKRHERQGGCEVHHIIPVADGGSDDCSNLILLCPNCHKMAHCGLLSPEKLSKSSLTAEEIEKRVRARRLEDPSELLLFKKFFRP